MKISARPLALASLLSLCRCGALPEGAPPDLSPPPESDDVSSPRINSAPEMEPLPAPTPSLACDSAPPGPTIQALGDVTGLWSGRVELMGDAVVPAGSRLEVCPGTRIVPMASTSKIIVRGELVLSGTEEAAITVDERPWIGITVEGKLSGGHITLTGATTCLRGVAGSDVSLVDSEMAGCRQAFSLANGARFDRVLVIGGNGVSIDGGVLAMTDSLIDLRHSGAPPDCTYWNGGGGNLSHVRFTGCHCPIHVNSAPEGFFASDSIFDGASVPIMIAKTSGVLTRNHILDGSPQVLDVGGGMMVDLGGNYWGGGAPVVSSSNASQFSNLESYARDPFEGIGPR